MADRLADLMVGPTVGSRVNSMAPEKDLKTAAKKAASWAGLTAVQRVVERGAQNP